MEGLHCSDRGQTLLFLWGVPGLRPINKINAIDLGFELKMISCTIFHMNYCTLMILNQNVYTMYIMQYVIPAEIIVF